MDTELMQRVAELRQKGRSPKEVARVLGGVKVEGRAEDPLPGVRHSGRPGLHQVGPPRFHVIAN